MKKGICIFGIGIVIIVLECGLVLGIQGTLTEESKIESQKISIIGKDKSTPEEEEEEVIMKPIPNVKPPAYTMESVELPKIEPQPALSEIEEPRKTPTKEEKLPKPTLYSFGLAYGNHETLLYDFTHTNEIKNVGYYFRTDRSRSDGFTFNDKPSFQRFSQDYLLGEHIINFKKYLLRTRVEYLNKDLTLPYQSNFVENRLKRSIGLSYEVKVQPESKLSLGFDIGRGNIKGSNTTAKNDVIDLHLGFYTPFKKGNPPLSIGTNVYQEKLKYKLESGNNDRKLRFYSLYVEGKRLKINPFLLLDAKVSWDEYKNNFSSSQGNFLLKSYYSMKENLTILGSIEQKLSLPTFDNLYINQDYRGIKLDLKPEKSFKCEISGDYCISNELFLEGTIFTHQVKNYIFWEGTSSTSYIYTPNNLGKADFLGLEFELRYYLNPKLSQNISYSYIQAKNRSNKGVIPHISENRLKMGLRYKDMENLTINLNAEYGAAAYNNVVKDSNKLPSYFVVNITGEKRVNENLFYSFSCENLLGDEYYYLGGYPEQKRRFTVGVRLRF